MANKMQEAAERARARQLSTSQGAEQRASRARQAAANAAVKKDWEEAQARRRAANRPPPPPSRQQTTAMSRPDAAESVEQTNPMRAAADRAAANNASTAKAAGDESRKMGQMARSALMAGRKAEAAQFVARKVMAERVRIEAVQVARHAGAVSGHFAKAARIRAQANQFRSAARTAKAHGRGQSLLAQASILDDQARRHDIYAEQLARQTVPVKVPVTLDPMVVAGQAAQVSDRVALGPTLALAGLEAGIPLAAIYGGGNLGHAMAACESGQVRALGQALDGLDGEVLGALGLQSFGANPAPPKLPPVKLDEAALKLLPAAEVREWRKIAKAGGGVPCPLAPSQSHCAPQMMSDADRAWLAAVAAKKAAGNPGPPPPRGASPERVAVYQQQAAAFTAANKKVCKRTGIGLSQKQTCKTAAEWAILDGRPKVPIGIQPRGGAKPGAAPPPPAGQKDSAASAGDPGFPGAGVTPPLDPTTKGDGAADLPVEDPYAEESSFPILPVVIGIGALAAVGVAVVVLK